MLKKNTSFRSDELSYYNDFAYELLWNSFIYNFAVSSSFCSSSCMLILLKDCSWTSIIPKFRRKLFCILTMLDLVDILAELCRNGASNFVCDGFWTWNIEFFLTGYTYQSWVEFESVRTSEFWWEGGLGANFFFFNQKKKTNINTDMLASSPSFVSIEYGISYNSKVKFHPKHTHTKVLYCYILWNVLSVSSIWVQIDMCMSMCYQIMHY